MHVNPYLNFEGRCQEALDFYKKAVGAEITVLMRCKDAPDQTGMRPEFADKILHSAFRIGDSTVMATDGYNSGKAAFQGISLAIHAKDEAEAKRIFAALSEGGEIRAPLSKTFFSPAFGMAADKFGVGWMIVVEQPNS